MQQLPQERLQIGTGAIAMIERALALTIDYVKERKAFGKAIIEFQNTQFKLAELKTEATIGRVFYNDCVTRHVNGGLDPVTASMAKYWLSDLQGKVVDECLQLHGGGARRACPGAPGAGLDPGRGLYPKRGGRRPQTN